jgi:chromosome segregation ATPase
MSVAGSRGDRGVDSRGLVTTEMQSIAKRIEGRCLERESERRALALAHSDRREVDEALQDLREAHQEARIAFLGELRKAQGAELELHLLHVEQRNRSKENRRWVEQDSRDGERLQEMTSSWRRELSTMAAAVVKRESYLLRIRGMIETNQTAMMNHQRKKQLLKEHNDTLTSRCDQMVQDSDRAQNEIKLLEEEDAARKAHVQRVADQVRSQLAKVRCCET